MLDENTLVEKSKQFIWQNIKKISNAHKNSYKIILIKD